MTTGDTPDWTGRGTTRYLGSISVTPTGIGNIVTGSLNAVLQSYDRALVVTCPKLAFGAGVEVVVAQTGGGLVTKDIGLSADRQLVLAYVNPALTPNWTVEVLLNAPAGAAQTYYVFSEDRLPFAEAENGDLPLNVAVVAGLPLTRLSTKQAVVTGVGVGGGWTAAVLIPAGSAIVGLSLSVDMRGVALAAAQGYVDVQLLDGVNTYFLGRGLIAETAPVNLSRIWPVPFVPTILSSVGTWQVFATVGNLVGTPTYDALVVVDYV